MENDNMYYTIVTGILNASKFYKKIQVRIKKKLVKYDPVKMRRSTINLRIPASRQENVRLTK